MQNFFFKLMKIYNAIEDELSKETFLARMRYELEPISKNRMRLTECYDELAKEEMVKRTERAYEYFHFPERYKKGTAMVDCGCYDGRESIFFANWCKDEYSKIYAFEPNKESAENCRKALCDLRAEVFQAALSDRNDTQTLVVEDGNRWKSYLISRGRKMPEKCVNTEVTQLLKLDDVVCEQVGFIKLQAMNGEYLALQGAENIIKRDAPILSVVIHGMLGETITIMNYIYELNPKYKFYFRQYHDAAKNLPGRCILVASVLEENENK